MRHLIAAISAALALTMTFPALAAADNPERTIELKDGSSLQIHRDGKMSMTDSRGRPMSMKDGAKMETRSGQVLMMRGNEVWRQIRPNQIGD